VLEIGKCKYGHGVEYCEDDYTCECNKGMTTCNKELGKCGVDEDAEELM
jgi:hypothetical protein